MRTDKELTVVKRHMNVMVYDTTPNTTDFSGAIPPYFLCGATLYNDDVLHHEGSPLEFSKEVSIDETTKSTKSKLRLQKTIHLASREWTFVITDSGSVEAGSEMAFIALGAVLILVSTISLSLLIYTNARKIRKISRIRAATEAEKTQVRLESARKVAQQERDLNDFIAHEVRNPLNAALCATTFVSASVNESEPLITEESRKNVIEDVQIIDRSLHFINDLLR
jgi:signal transduction histidine kinase